MHRNSILLSMCFAFLTSLCAQAVKIDISVDISRQARYPACETHAERMRSSITQFINETDEAEKERYKKEILSAKKALKKCEKREKKWYMKALRAVSGGEVTVTTTF